MEIVIAILVIALLLGVIIAGVVESINQWMAIRTAHAQLAKQFQGTFTPGNLIRRPSVRIVHRGAHVLIDSFSGPGSNGVSFTEVHVGWPDPRLRCEIYPATVFTRVGKLLGMENIIVGSSDFDKSYQVSGNDPEVIRRLLSPRVQFVIAELRWHLENDDIFISFSGGRLLIKKLGLIQDYQPLAQLTTLALEFFDHCLIAQAAVGIEFVPPLVASQGPPICQVCGEPIEADPVLCRACKTPHHKDCWSYYGACSTYGCGEKRFTLPRDSVRRKAS